MPAPFSFDLDRLPETEADIDFSDLEREFAVPNLEFCFDSIVVVDNVPVVDEAKEKKLLGAIQKIFKGCGRIRENGVHMPMEEKDGKSVSKGFLFIEFETPEMADLAVRQVNNYRMDKQHVLTVNHFDDVDKAAQVEDEFHEPEEEKFEEREHLRDWLLDQRARDQFITYRGDDVAVFWNNKKDEAELVHNRTNWTETYVQWAPQGTYLATVHRQGVALWGGKSWAKIMRFFHPGVKLIDFSPNERYLVSWSNEPIQSGVPGSPFGPDSEGHQIAIWDVLSGVLLRTFPGNPDKNAEPGPAKVMWPAFKWSPSSRYFARLTPGQAISVYEAPSMGLLDKKSIKIEGVRDFEWSPASQAAAASADSEDKKRPRDEMLAYWTPEVGNQPARITLLNVPSRAVMRTKNIFSVSDCRIHWHPQGDYLCIKVDRHTKSKKSIFSNLEIFHTREKGIPVEVIEMKEIAIAFAWEPLGDRFSVITTTDPNLLHVTGPTMPITPRTNVAFYAASGVLEGSFRLIKLLEKKTANGVFWSPKGRHLVLITLRSQITWDVEFWDLDLETTTKATVDPSASVQLLASQEHYGVTDLEWDPTGRYVVTSASSWRHTMENGYTLWDFRGEMLQKHTVDRFKQFIWRPRPKTLLSEEQQRKIRRNLKDYSREFELEDQFSQTAASRAVLEERRRLLQEWNAWRQRVEKDLTEARVAAGQDPNHHVPGDDEYETIEELVEEVVSEKEEIVKEKKK
ncbi:eukaryotic translation initiation factor eIF2A-domain-containing protein [Thamnocephalis sphaerospora]|uniref:Eukaryotic translation initiation factor 3 subunit B n=1 Tax=Thamnocephalis sphaerospora TaxID=78915 RepID=A0A4V1IWV1_9FUNG|nr:eukaryotic translation initiation factor eIF2A-domain-containing protein [Thamnocephalis sphaerospora]|eukprot:RKP08839.1 eukaryotic translation initiation factor eIF2A-domain-containing protein [Thamnocephalis sphaerospora]